MASKKKWKKRALRAEEARGVDQAKAFERASNLEGQLRAIDHILLQREIPGPSIQEWVQQAQVIFQELIQCRREERSDGYSAQDLENMRSKFYYPYIEHFVPPIPPGATPPSNEEAQSIVRALIQEWPNATGS